jgi:hypothetical protein
MLEDISVPKGWDVEEWFEYQEYLDSLTPQQFKEELKFIEAAADCKRRGKNFVEYTSVYDC